MRRLQDIRIQNKLIGVFTVVLAAGVLAIGWNIYTINQARTDVLRVVERSNDDIGQTLAASRAEVENVVNAGQAQVETVFDQTDELLFLRVLQLEFRELEGVEKDYVLAADPSDERGLIEAYATVVGWLQDDLSVAIEQATNDRVRETLTGLQDDLQAQIDLFDQLVTLVQTDPQAAQRLSLEGSEGKKQIYNTLAELVNDQWDAAIEDMDQTRFQMQDTSEQVRAQMQQAVDRTDARLGEVSARADSQMQRAIYISLITIALFLAAGGVAAAVVLIISRQIVTPMLKMASVAEAIEHEQFQSAALLDPIASRQDEIGQLARVFRRMAREVFERMERLKQQVAELRIVIDDRKVSQEVSEITNTDYFQMLQAKVNTLRQREQARQTGNPPQDAPLTPSAGGSSLG